MNTIPMEILRQLGGNRFLAMTGAKIRQAVDSSLALKVGARFVIITLTPSDTYRVSLYTSKMHKQKTIEDVYCDTLQSTFEELTGLYTTP